MILRTLVVCAVVAHGAIWAADELPKPAVIPQPEKMEVREIVGYGEESS